LKLIKEDKIERLIFLSAYDKRNFPDGDPRKIEIIKESFGRVVRGQIVLAMELIPFDSETQGQSKVD